MKIRRLQLESRQMARIDIQAQLARLSINAPMRGIQTVQQQYAKMTVRRENPNLEIDMESLFNNIGLQRAGTLTREMRSQSYAQVRQAIKNIENNGDYVAALPSQGNPIAAIARTAMLRTKSVSTSGSAPDPTVHISSNPGSLSIDWSTQDLSITWDDYQAPIITFDPKHSVDVILVQKPHLEFKVIEQSFPPESGRRIDQEV